MVIETDHAWRLNRPSCSIERHSLTQVNSKAIQPSPSGLSEASAGSADSAKDRTLKRAEAS